jgi:hypothetical protein
MLNLCYIASFNHLQPKFMQWNGIKHMKNHLTTSKIGQRDYAWNAIQFLRAEPRSQ